MGTCGAAKAYMYRNEDIFGLYAESGFDCISWYDLDLHFTAPNLDLERNACRNANLSPSWGEGKPWCFTKVVYISSRFRLLPVRSRDLSQTEKEITACKDEQIHIMTTIFTQNDNLGPF